MITIPQRVTLAVLGCAVVVVVGTGDYLQYVRPVMQWPLLLTAGLLVYLAAYGAFEPREESGHAGRGKGSQEHGYHDHSGGSWWIMLVPIVLLATLGTGQLGAFAASRAVDGIRPAPAVADPGDGWPPLPTDRVSELPVSEFLARAAWSGSDGSLTGRPVRLTGFVLNDARRPGPAGTWTLARMGIMCCAADATVYRVSVQGAPPAPAPGARSGAETWVQVTGRWVPDTTPLDENAAVDRPVRFAADAVKVVTAPDNPYDG